MFSLLGSTAFVGLHTGHSVTLVAYLSRVVVSLVALAGIGLTVFGGVRAIEIIRSTASRRGNRRG